MRTQLDIGTDQLLKLEGLEDSSGEWVNGADVTATVYESDGKTEVEGQEWPLTLEYVSDSDGNYEGVLEDTLEIEPHRRYVVELIADVGTTKRTWREPVIAVYGGW